MTLMTLPISALDSPSLAMVALVVVGDLDRLRWRPWRPRSAFLAISRMLALISSDAGRDGLHVLADLFGRGRNDVGLRRGFFGVGAHLRADGCKFLGSSCHCRILGHLLEDGLQVHRHFLLALLNRQLLGDDFPGHHRTEVVLVLVVNRADEKVERVLAKLDVRLMRQVAWVGQQFPLVLRSLVKDVNRLTDHLIYLDRQDRLKRPKSLRRSRVHVLQLQVAVSEHDINGSLLHHGRDPGHLSLHFQLLGDDLPSHHRPDEFLICVVNRTHEEFERLRSHLDVGFVRQILRIAEHSALVFGPFVEDVDGLSKHLFGFDRQIFFQSLKRAKRIGIQVLDHQVQVSKHHVERYLIEHGLRMSEVDALIFRWHLFASVSVLMINSAVRAARHLSQHFGNLSLLRQIRLTGRGVDDLYGQWGNRHHDLVDQIEGNSQFLHRGDQVCGDSIKM